MGLMYTDSKETELYKAYGCTVAGKPDVYVWTYDGSGRSEECYSSITITGPRGNIVLSVHLGNNAIFKEIFDRNIDNFLWWLKEDNPLPIDMESNFIKVFIQNDQLFSYKIENRKRRQKEEEERLRAIHEERGRIEAYYKELEVQCKNKDYYICKPWDEVCIVRINYNVDKVKELLNNSSKYDIERYIRYAERYPEKELTVLFSGNLENAIKFVSGK